MSHPTRILLVLAVVVVVSAPLGARAAPPRADAPTAMEIEEARQHYKRGVDLYGESNLTAALIEFRRAYDIAPSYNVLYNVGQIQFQLHEHAEALKAFQAYLQDGGARVPAARRAEVERQIAYLRDRVGYVDLTSNADGAELLIDGVSMGKTPVTQALVVSVGRRRVDLMKGDRVIASRQVDVAAGDHVKVELNEASSEGHAADAAGREPSAGQGAAGAPARGDVDQAPRARGASPAVRWSSAGVLGAGTAVFGALALSAAADLKTKRGTDGETRSELDAASSKAKTMALVTDALGVATVLAAGAAVYLTLAPRTAHSGRASTASSLRVRVGPGGVAVAGSF